MVDLKTLKENNPKDDLAKRQLEQIRELFPSVIKEIEDVDENGNVYVKEAIDFDTLKQLLSDNVISDKKACYEMTWSGKANAIRLGRPERIDKVLKPVKEKSVDWDNTKNIYIEGDNLEALKLLYNHYAHTIKMIYIDPPYNTGNDFVYNDNFKQNQKEYDIQTGAINEEGIKVSANKDTDGKYHTNWLNMMYPRLSLARDLLSDDGVIFISIDDHEQANLKKICDEIFGAWNFVASAPRKTGPGAAASRADYVLRKPNDFVLIYGKNISNVSFNKIIKGQKDYEYSDELGRYTLCEFQATGSDSFKENRPNLYYPIYLQDDGSLALNKNSNTIETILPKKIKGRDGRWMWKKEKFELDSNNYIVYKNSRLYRKVYFDKNSDQNIYQVDKAYFDDSNYQNSKGTVELQAIFNNNIFDNPKPIKLIEKFLTLTRVHSNDIVLDFFSGSASTAHAVMQLNAEDGGSRRFIMVQIPELCEYNSEAKKAGYNTITDIGEERIRRAGKKIKEEHPLTTQDLDTGFRVFKIVDSPLSKDAYSIPSKTEQLSLDQQVESLQDNVNSFDLLFKVILDRNLDLSSPIKECTETINQKQYTYYLVGDSPIGEDYELIACFEKDIDIKLFEKLLKLKPVRFATCEKSFKDDKAKLNFKNALDEYASYLENNDIIIL